MPLESLDALLECRIKLQSVSHGFQANGLVLSNVIDRVVVKLSELHLVAQHLTILGCDRAAKSKVACTTVLVEVGVSQLLQDSMFGLLARSRVVFAFFLSLLIVGLQMFCKLFSLFLTQLFI